MKSIGLAMPALLALAACDGGTQSADMTTQEAEAGGNIVGNSSASKPVGEASAETEIPVAIRGRWALDGDCEPGSDVALTIDASSLEFYESVGTLDDIEASGPTRIRATFDFTGEGMSWEREVELTVEDQGAALIRREYGEDAAPEPFRYAKCDQGR